MRIRRLLPLLPLTFLLAACDGRIDDIASIGPNVVGHVRDARTREPIPRAFVEVGVTRTRSVADGFYVAMLIERGRQPLRATAPGYLPYEATVEVQDLGANHEVLMQPATP